jgi:hypothetical protein
MKTYPGSPEQLNCRIAAIKIDNIIQCRMHSLATDAALLAKWAILPAEIAAPRFNITARNAVLC